MSNSIFSINTWDTASSYSTHDIVHSGGRFYYAKKNLDDTNEIVVNDVNANTSTSWGGYLIHPITLKVYPFFFWRPSYQTQANFEPKVSVVKYGDGYEKRISEQINTSLLILDLKFEGLTTSEATAILHFLHVRAAKSAFIYKPSEPFTVSDSDAKLFVCRKWSSSNTFFNNHTVQASFEEVPA